jgi:hypothetical protein
VTGYQGPTTSGRLHMIHAPPPQRMLASVAYSICPPFTQFTSAFCRYQLPIRVKNTERLRLGGVPEGSRARNWSLFFGLDLDGNLPG